MAKEIDKIIQSPTAPKDKNVLWDDGKELKINRRGVWESTNKGDSSIILKYLINPVMVSDTGCDIPADLASVIMNLNPEYSDFKIPVFGLFYIVKEEGYFPVTSCNYDRVTFGNGTEFYVQASYNDEDGSYYVTLG